MHGATSDSPVMCFPAAAPATSVLGVSLAINPLENRWPIRSRVQGEPSLINADCQGASLMYFSFKESVSKRFSLPFFFLLRLWFRGKQLAFFFFPLCLFFGLCRMGGGETQGQFKPAALLSCVLTLGSRESGLAAL